MACAIFSSSNVHMMAKETHWKLLVRRRSRRGWWVFVAWVPLYWFTAGDFAGSFDLGPWGLLPILGPLGLVIMQLIRPTFLVLAIIFYMMVAFIAYMIFATIDNIYTGAERLSDSGVLGIVYDGFLIGLSIALFVVRPRLKGD